LAAVKLTVFEYQCEGEIAGREQRIEMVQGLDERVVYSQVKGVRS
jgi:hypothetical protein